MAGSRQMLLVSRLWCSRISRQASAIARATPLGLQAPGLMITSASRKRLPWGRLRSDISSPYGSGMLLTAAAQRTAARRAGEVFGEVLITPRPRGGAVIAQYI